jgi:hypothetical protein
MLDSLESTRVASVDDSTCSACVSVRSQAECIIPGHKPRIYKPLLERPTCGELHVPLVNNTTFHSGDITNLSLEVPFSLVHL